MLKRGSLRPLLGGEYQFVSVTGAAVTPLPEEWARILPSLLSCSPRPGWKQALPSSPSSGHRGSCCPAQLLWSPSRSNARVFVSPVTLHTARSPLQIIIIIVIKSQQVQNERHVQVCPEDSLNEEKQRRRRGIPDVCSVTVSISSFFLRIQSMRTTSATRRESWSQGLEDWRVGREISWELNWLQTSVTALHCACMSLTSCYH